VAQAGQGLFAMNIAEVEVLEHFDEPFEDEKLLDVETLVAFDRLCVLEDLGGVFAELGERGQETVEEVFVGAVVCGGEVGVFV